MGRMSLSSPVRAAGVALAFSLALWTLSGCESLGSEALLGGRSSGDHGRQALPAAKTTTPSPPRSLTPTPTPTALPAGRPRPTDRPNMEDPLVIGQSVEGRPLEVFRFGRGPVHRMIVAGIHGGYEWNTIALAHELRDHLAEHPELVPEQLSLFLLLALNPDGEARSHSYAGRANANGVDLNRNWPAHWKKDWSRSGCWNYLPIGAGPQPVSEPEVAALMGFILEQRISALISYHSAALGVFAGGRPSSQASLSLAEAIAEVSPYPYPPLDSGCEYTGQFADWAAENGIAAVDVELSNHQDTELEINLRVLQVFLDWKP